ncbi:YSIRK-type signal peptide-containing protein [Streptococcus cuniculi]|uniref:YSIRK-type signal peptide-containing protein n=1 Tax=Streptococcus cuniculi TaxID=1432788 RepID=A0A4Y9JGW5_9STRE|nr:YSIRK-type signal peptide-containing protein [Streptococcus cuniculi]TFU99035.1 YSIRK-type signal peptide-containing protein [Streptococcus cuniculi]
MRKTKKNKFDWYGLSQRFSIRKYYFGAASVLLGIAMMVSLATTVSANDLDTVVSTPSTTEIHNPLPMRIGFRSVTARCHGSR